MVRSIVAFYMLLDWDRKKSVVDSWILRGHVEIVRQIASDINAAIAVLICGQAMLCIVLGTIYATSLTLAGLNFGVLIGLFAGLVNFIPYIIFCCLVLCCRWVSP